MTSVATMARCRFQRSCRFRSKDFNLLVSYFFFFSVNLGVALLCVCRSDAGMSHAPAERRGWKERRDRKMAILFSSRRGYRPSGTKSSKSTSNVVRVGNHRVRIRKRANGTRRVDRVARGVRKSTEYVV